MGGCGSEYGKSNSITVKLCDDAETPQNE